MYERRESGLKPGFGWLLRWGGGGVGGDGKEQAWEQEKKAPKSPGCNSSELSKKDIFIPSSLKQSPLGVECLRCFLALACRERHQSFEMESSSKSALLVMMILINMSTQ